MSSVPALLRRYEETCRRYIELERELADLRSQIAAESPKPRRRSATRTEVSDATRAVLRILRDAKEALPPREVAARLGITAMLASQRLSRAVKLGYAERTGNARYTAVDAVPAL